MGNKLSAAKKKANKKKDPDNSSNTPVSTGAQASAAALLHSGDNCEASTANVNFKYEKGVCALSWWEPIRLLEEGSISDIHLVRQRKSFLKVRYKEKRSVMDLAKKQPNRDIVGDEESDGKKLRVLKSIHKDHIGDELVLEEMRREIHVMSRLNHPNIVRLIEAYERRRHIYLVLEYCSGGNLAQRVPMEEKNAAVVVRKVLSAVSYLHSMGLAHRDIKLENIMFDSTKEVKLIDFGLAAVFLADEYKADKVGTLYSMAPQVLQGVYNQKCDLWSVGVVAYLLLSGKQPFWGPNKNLPWAKRRKVMIDRIMRCKYAPMSGKSWEGISKSAKSFVRSLLIVDPDVRPTADEALESDWIQANGDGSATEIDRRENNELQMLRRAILDLIAGNLAENEIQDLQAYLEVNDDEGLGFIKVGELRNILIEEVAESCIHWTKAEAEDVFEKADQKGLDMSEVTINYVDLLVEALVGKGRNDIYKLAKELDDLDVAGNREVKLNDLRPIILDIFPLSSQEGWLEDIEVSRDGVVNTAQVLELCSHRVARYCRDSIRSADKNGQHPKLSITTDDDEDLVTASNVMIPGGKDFNESEEKEVQYVYSSIRNRMLTKGEEE